MIYLPLEVTNSKCAYVYDKDTFRVYEQIPQQNTTVAYTDYFINSNYISRTGSTTFGQWSTISYDCLDSSLFTQNPIYRNDFDKILIIAFILIFMYWFLISKLVKRLFYGRKIF